MKKIKILLSICLLFIIDISVVNAAPKSTSEALEYVKNKDNGYCVYNSGNMVLGVKTNGTSKDIKTYLWDNNANKTEVTEKKVFPLRGYEKNKCPAYAMVVGGYLNNDSTWYYAIFLSDSESTLNNVFEDSNVYKSGSIAFEKATSGFIYNSGAVSVDKTVGIMTPNADGISPGTTYEDENKEEKDLALSKVKQEYLEKYKCVYIDEKNRIAFGYSKNSRGELYFKGVRTTDFNPPSTSKFSSGFVGEIAGQCAKYAIAAQGTYEEKSIYVVLKSDDSSLLKNDYLSLKKIVSISVAMENIGVGNQEYNESVRPEGDADKVLLPSGDVKQFNICDQDGVKQVFHIAGYLIFIAKLVVPLLLIIMGTVDVFSAIKDPDEKGIKDQLGKLIKRIIAAVIIFFIPTIINFAFSLIDEATSYKNDFSACGSCLFTPFNGDCNYKRVGEE